MSISYENSIDYLSSLFRDELKPPLIMLTLEILLFGAYTVIFGLYLYLQVQHKGRQRYYQASILLLFLLGSAAVPVSICNFVQVCLGTMSMVTTEFNADTIPILSRSNSLQFALRAIYTVANAVADALLLYRCYIVWASRKWVILGPGVIAAINTIMAIVNLFWLWKLDPGNTFLFTAASSDLSRKAFYIFLGSNLVANLLLTGLIAGRLWHISHCSQRYLGGDPFHWKRMNRMIRLILESGVIYPIALLAYILSSTISNRSEITEPLLTMVVGIAPTIMMVRLDLGRSIESASGSAGNSSASDLETQPLSPVVQESRDIDILHRPNHDQTREAGAPTATIFFASNLPPSLPQKYHPIPDRFPNPPSVPLNPLPQKYRMN
ncbi:hypothetical protein D9757_004974 [Collybiopsis confluens]|uniref:Uncharacterized protein n=1 Tax=Collybiopsis confluens TaxID=2823264 RepID=A0A8H5MC87_9AGAR|nr:hypothetical protein D9757_004974 [Collybiopsis confluens]